MAASANELTKGASDGHAEERQPERRIIMGIDSATIHMGWGVIEYLPGSRTSRYLGCGVVKVPENMPVPQRLEGIATEVRAVVSAYQPTDGVVENALVSERVLLLDQRSAIALGEERGAVLCTLVQCEIRNISSYTPAQVKAVVTGNGASSNEQVSFWVKNSLVDGNLIELVPFDATGALALALTHAILYGQEGVVVAAARHSRDNVPGDVVDGGPRTS